MEVEKGEICNMPFIAEENVTGDHFLWPSAHFPFIISFGYLFLVWYLQKYKILKPLPHWVALVYNLFITIISAILTVGGLHAIIVDTQKRGEYFFLICESREMKFRNKPNMMFWILMYWITKIIELADTFLKIANGSRVIFLHVFHHATMAVATWHCYYTDYTLNWLIVPINSFVHVVMYFYYTQLVWNRMNGKGKPTWGIYVTYIQLIQFWTVFLTLCTMLVLTAIKGTERCSNSKFVLAVFIFLTIMFLQQFTSFFYKRWGKKKKKKKKEEDEKER